MLAEGTELGKGMAERNAKGILLVVVVIGAVEVVGIEAIAVVVIGVTGGFEVDVGAPPRLTETIGMSEL